MALPYSEIVSVTDTTYPATPQITVPFVPQEIAVVVLDSTAANTVDVSFDGTNRHARFVPTQLGGFSFRFDGILGTTQGVWFQSPNTVSVQVIATPR